MTNQKIIEVGSTFLKEYLRKIDEIAENRKANPQETSIAKIFGQNAFNTWSILFSDKRSPFYSVELPKITENNFDGMIKAFSYFIVAEFEEIFHALNSPFQGQQIKDVLSLSLANIPKERISEIVGDAIGGEDSHKYLSTTEQFIGDNRLSAKNPADELVEKYFWGIRIMFDDPEGNIIKNAEPRTRKDVEELALEIYKQNIGNFLGSTNTLPIETVGKLTKEEQEYLVNWISQIEDGEKAQVKDLIENCNNAFQFAKTHSVYLKDWEKTKQRMEENLKNGVLPPGVSSNLHREIIDATEKIMQKKFEVVRNAFQEKFGESIYNYLGPDGKTKKLFGIFG